MSWRNREKNARLNHLLRDTGKLQIQTTIIQELESIKAP